MVYLGAGICISSIGGWSFSVYSKISHQLLYWSKCLSFYLSIRLLNVYSILHLWLVDLLNWMIIQCLLNGCFVKIFIKLDLLKPLKQGIFIGKPYEKIFKFLSYEKLLLVCFFHGYIRYKNFECLKVKSSTMLVQRRVVLSIKQL